jgi:fluoride exporter
MAPDPTDPASDARHGPPLHRQVVPGILVFVGGALGTAARYGLGHALPTESGRWPTGTFVANLVGALVLGALLEALVRAGPDAGWRRRLRLLVGTGFCGGLTTYSTLAVEGDLLLRDHHQTLALAYLSATVVVGLLATVAGIALAATFRGAA